MKKIKKVVALLSIVSLLIATAFSASVVEANASYDPETNHATVLHNEKLYLLQARHNSHKMSTNALGQV